jgi:hypothetical protein
MLDQRCESYMFKQIQLLDAVPVCLVRFASDDERLVVGSPLYFPNVHGACNALLLHMWSTSSALVGTLASTSTSTAFSYWLRVCARINICSLQTEACAAHPTTNTNNTSPPSLSTGEQDLHRCIEPALVRLQELQQTSDNSHECIAATMEALRHVNDFLRGIAECPTRALLRSRFAVRRLVRHVYRSVGGVEGMLFRLQEALRYVRYFCSFRNLDILALSRGLVVLVSTITHNQKQIPDHSRIVLSTTTKVYLLCISRNPRSHSIINFRFLWFIGLGEVSRS